jgi:hypothetical protein
VKNVTSAAQSVLVRSLDAFLCVVAAGALAGSASAADFTTTSPVAHAASDQKRACIYDNNSIAGLSSFAAKVHRSVIDCVMVYEGDAQWAGWDDPWFVTTPSGDFDFADWVRQSPPGDRRQLIISQPLLPWGVASDDSNWRAEGAAGLFTPYAEELGQNLVTAGLGDAIIRLDWEANGDWGYDNVGYNPTQYGEWVAFWRNTVIAMRSVPGAHFRFDWTVNNGKRPIPFAAYYPGDDVVDIIGCDVYDIGSTPGAAGGWSEISGQDGGLDQLIAFARSHHKPISIPEWGVGPVGVDSADGDDPQFVQGIADVVRSNDVAYQSYFYNYGWASELQNGPGSLAAYQAAFGDGGYAAGGLGGAPAPTSPTDAASTSSSSESQMPSTAAATAAAPPLAAPSGSDMPIVPPGNHVASAWCVKVPTPRGTTPRPVRARSACRKLSKPARRRPKMHRNPKHAHQR